MDKQIAFDLACATRVLAREGLSVLIAGHLSVAFEGRMYVNRFGPSFARVRPSDVLVTDFDGKVLEGEGFVNNTILLHGVLHRLLPSVKVIVHTHPRSVVTMSSFRIVPEIYDQETCFLADDMEIFDEDYSGLASTADRVAPMAAALERSHCLILPNHGALTSGDNLAMATVRMILLESAAKRHLEVTEAARTLGATPRAIPARTAAVTRKELEGLRADGLMWRDYVDRLKVTDPDLWG